MRKRIIALLDNLSMHNDASKNSYDYNETIDGQGLLGIARFLKTIAFEENDDELLAKAAKLEMKVSLYIEESNQEYENFLFEMDKNPHFDSAIRELCIKAFYKDCLFKIDMSKYKQKVEENLGLFKDKDTLDRLLKYIDEKNVLDKAYKEVRDDLLDRFDNDQDMGAPTNEDLVKSFESIRERIYRRADKHVASQFEAVKNS